MLSTLIVLSGPPLPGRWSLARALERRLGARRFVADAGSVALFDILRALGGDRAVVLVDGDLATREARAEVLELAPDGERCQRLLVEWRCTRKQAEREVFHRYASRPRVLAAGELERYLEDARVREAIGDEVAAGVTVVDVGPERTLDEQVQRVVGLLRDAPAPPRAGDDRARRVLVVEDDAEERAILREVLDELGFAVEQAPNAAVALALLDEGVRVELLISDHLMPGMTGVELARAVGERHPEVRTILVTAFSDEAVCRRAVEARAVTVLSKPLSLMDLERVLDEAYVGG